MDSKDYSSKEMHAVSAENFFLAAAQSEIVSLQWLRDSMTWLTALLQLIHELQRERGLSNAFLVSGGQQLVLARQQQITASDKALAQFKQCLPPLLLPEQRSSTSPGLLNLLAASLLVLHDLPAIRAKNDVLESTALASTTAYNNAVKSLLHVVFEVADHATDPELMRSLSTLFLLIQLKEYTGQERAWTVIGFSRRRFSERLCGAVNSAVSKRDEVLGQLQVCATDEVRTTITGVQESTCCVDLDKLRQLRDELGSEQDIAADLAEVWYYKATDYIDLLHEVIERLSRQLVSLCEQRVDAARRHRSAAQEAIAALSEQVPSFLNAANPAHPVQFLVAEQNREILSLTLELERAKQALEARKVIERAKALLMRKFKIDDHEAYRQLQKTAMRENCAMERVAKQVIRAYG